MANKWSVTNHAVDRFIERAKGASTMTRSQARKRILELMESSELVSPPKYVRYRQILRHGPSNYWLCRDVVFVTSGDSIVTVAKSHHYQITKRGAK